MFRHSENVGHLSAGHPILDVHLAESLSDAGGRGDPNRGPGATATPRRDGDIAGTQCLRDLTPGNANCLGNPAE
jgi:hypothetical protein